MKNRRGMALPLALFVLLVVGALVGAAFWLGVADHRAGLGSLGVRRLSSSLFLVTARGFSRSGAATQRVGVLVRLKAPRLGFRQPLLAAGPVQLGPDAQISHPTIDPLDYCGSHTQADGGSAAARSSKGDQAMSINIKRIGHVGFLVSDFERSYKFYT